MSKSERKSRLRNRLERLGLQLDDDYADLMSIIEGMAARNAQRDAENEADRKRLREKRALMKAGIEEIRATERELRELEQE